jgi:hypothetical protein
MASEPIIKRARIRNRLARDFDALKRDLINYSRAYATGSFTDFNESSPGMTIMEFQAYLADGLYFAIDQAFNESGDSATEVENVMANAKAKGYKPLGKRAAVGEVSWAVEVPATTDTFGNIIPDEAYTPILLKGSQSVATNGTIFETLEDVYFSASLGRRVTGSQFDGTTGIPTHFAIQRTVDITAGQTVSETFTVSEFQAFRQIELTTPDVLEVIDVLDSEGEEWFEVDYLAQDWIFMAQTNVNSDSNEVPYILKLQSAPRRFVVERDITTGVSTLVFGSGDGLSYDDELVPNIASYALPLAGRRTYGSYSIDPQNFLKTRALGLSPHGTTLTVRYRVGGGSESNVPARAIRQPARADLSFSSTSLNAQRKGAVESSVGCINFVSTSGGGSTETIREIKANSAAYFAAQNRAVTREDIVARTLSLPSKFGGISKAFAKVSTEGRYAYDLHILAEDVDGNLSTATPSLKANLATYLQKFKMLTDGVNILDADVLDLRLNYAVSVDSGKNRSEVLSNINAVLADRFDISRLAIEAPIVISELVSIIDSVNGVGAVIEITFTNVFGTTSGLSYSNNRFDVNSHIKNGLLRCPEGSIFQIRHTGRDILGSAK